LEKKEKTVWPALSAKQFDRSGTWQWVLPEGWKDVDALHSSWKGESSPEAGLELQGLGGERLYAIVKCLPGCQSGWMVYRHHHTHLLVCSEQ
jgi:hypothetical protein